MNRLSTPRIAVVLPAYNEAQTIAATIEAFHAELPQALIVVVNNNSQDDTRQIAADTLARLNADGRVINEPRQGKGNAMRRAAPFWTSRPMPMCWPMPT